MIGVEVVIGVDPGLATGISRVFPATFAWEGSFTLDHLSASKWLFEVAQHYGPRLVFACEEFIPRKGAIDWMPESVEVTGVLKLASYWYGCGIVMQSPSDAKAFVGNDRLRNLGWWAKGGSDHARDADRHVLLHFARAGWYTGSVLRIPNREEKP